MDDLAIIVGLQETGPAFLDQLADKEKIIAYEKLYLNNELEENSFEKYTEYIINNTIVNLWKHLITVLSTEEILALIKRFMTYIVQKNYEIEKILYFLTNIRI